MSEVFGQHRGRTERIQQTQRWLGAKPTDVWGNEVTSVREDIEPDMDVVYATLQQIRTAFASGVRIVRISETHLPTLEVLVSQLEDEELEHVICDHLDGTLAEFKEQRETNTELPAPVRDIVREARPNVLRVEDGTLTKSD